MKELPIEYRLILKRLLAKEAVHSDDRSMVFNFVLPDLNLYCRSLVESVVFDYGPTPVNKTTKRSSKVKAGYLLEM